MNKTIKIHMADGEQLLFRTQRDELQRFDLLEVNQLISWLETGTTSSYKISNNQGKTYIIFRNLIKFVTIE